MTTKPTLSERFKRRPLSYLAGIGCSMLLLFICFLSAIATFDRWASTPSAPESTAKLSRAAYDKVYTGMKCSELPELFGRPSDTDSDVSVMNSTTTGYTWFSKLTERNDIGANVTIMCEAGLVVSKIQIGLR